MTILKTISVLTGISFDDLTKIENQLEKFDLSIVEIIKDYREAAPKEYATQATPEGWIQYLRTAFKHSVTERLIVQYGFADELEYITLHPNGEFYFLDEYYGDKITYLERLADYLTNYSEVGRSFNDNIDDIKSLIGDGENAEYTRGFVEALATVYPQQGVSTGERAEYFLRQLGFDPQELYAKAHKQYLASLD